MLVLMRHVGESVMIGEDVVVTVIKVERNRVRLGIDAPADVPVDREEIFNKKRVEQGLPPVQRKQGKK